MQSEKTTSECTREQFQKLLDDHDWYYNNSDDNRVWSRGQKEANIIVTYKRHNDEFEEMYNNKRKEVFKHLNNNKDGKQELSND